MVNVISSPTPNANAMKYVVQGHNFGSDFQMFESPDQANGSPVAVALFELPGVEVVSLCEDFVTVEKSGHANWNDLDSHRAPPFKSANLRIRNRPNDFSPKLISQLPPRTTLTRDKMKLASLNDHQIKTIKEGIALRQVLNLPDPLPNRGLHLNPRVHPQRVLSSHPSRLPS